MAHQPFNQFGGGHGHGGVDPNNLMFGSFGSFNDSANTTAHVTDEDLLGAHDISPNQGFMHDQRQDYPQMHDMDMSYNNNFFSPQQGHNGLSIDQSSMPNYAKTPDGDPGNSPFVSSYPNSNLFPMHHHSQSIGNAMQSPISYSGSVGSDVNNDGSDGNYLNAKSRAQMSQTMQRRASNTRSPLTPKTAAAMSTLSPGPYGAAQPIRTPNGHRENFPPNAPFMHTPSSLPSLPESGFPSPMNSAMTNPSQIADVLRKGGTSVPANLPGRNAVSTQEMKRKRRRESHNLVERRRRDNINERIQDLSKLVPAHRLEDEKIRKLIQNGTPLSPSLTGISSPVQATSGLAGPGAKRATGAGNITTGLPLEEKDKGPNKGDILNGAVSWTRDLMWLLNKKIQEHDVLINTIQEMGGALPFQLTEDERRMQSELVEAVEKNGMHTFAYSRCDGSGLRVPNHTDYKGAALDGSTESAVVSASPESPDLLDYGADMGDPTAFADFDEDSGPASAPFKDDDDFGMDLVHD
ncbi:hypothetical protein F4780DRAFT_332186 [Xylariomycetidae sp. FL0641]|nr:hypothetical protein F4780DRAFT_332186 [Xylariomycetidae sp. FL0641]